MLLSSITDVRSYVPVSTGLSWEALSPYVDIAEREYLKPLIGDELYDRLSEYISGSAPSGSGDDADKLEEAKYFCKKATANLAIWEGYHIFSANISDKGARRVEGEEHKSLYKYQEDELKDRLENTGQNTLDSLLAFLETNVEYFPEFEESDTYSNLKASIIKDTATFNSIYDISKSRLVFLRLSRFITQAIDLDIKGVLGDTLYTELITEIKKDSPNEKISNLLPYVQKPLVYYAVARGLDELGYDITKKGVTYMKSATNSPSMRREQADHDTVFNMARKAQDTGDRYLEAMKQFLIANATTYTTYSGVSGHVFKRDNTGKKTVWK